MRLINADAAIKDANLNWGGVYDAVMLKRFLDAQPSVALDGLVPKPDNAPLTLAQLQTMDREPVWSKKLNRWAFVSVFEDAVSFIDDDGKVYPLGMARPVYRYKPEGVLK